MPAIKINILRLVAVLATAAVFTGAAFASDQPARIAAGALTERDVVWPTLSVSNDAWLQSRLQAEVDALGLSDAVSRQALGIALVDITDPTRPRMASINGHKAMYAASLPKIAIMFGAFHKAEAGLLELDRNTRDTMTAMIRASSNAAATAILERVGFEYLADLLQSEPYRLYDASQNGGLWVGKAYAKKHAWRRDPLHNLSHAATPFEVARFYYLMETGRLSSHEACRQMKVMLSEPAIQHKFVNGLMAHRPESRIYRKSGTWRTYHADSALVERDGRRYIAVALANDPRGGKWLARLIVSMDDLIFDAQNVARDGLRRADSARLGPLG